jgi:hypothetical protein
MAVGRIRTGVILILIGILFLLNTTGVLDYSVWEFFLVWWPLILIAIGIEKIFGATRSLKPLAYISPVIIIATVAYAVVAQSDGGGFRDTRDRRSFRWSVPAEASVAKLDLEMNFGGGRLKIGGDADSGQLLEGQFYHRGRKPKLTADRRGDRMEVSLDRSSTAIGLSSRSREKWILKLNETVPVDLRLDAGAALVRLDLEDLILNNLNLETGAADINVILGSKSEVVHSEIDCGAASIDIVIPHDAGLRLVRDLSLSALTTEGIELVETDSFKETPDFENRPVRVFLNIDSGVSSLRIRRSSPAGVGSSI